ILFKDYQRLPIVSGIACGTITSIDDINNGSKNLITNYPNPFVSTTTLKYKTRGGHTLIQIFDTMGRLVATPVNKVQPGGEYTVQFDSGNLATGIFYARLQNGVYQHLRSMLKVKE
ncbi:MAG TPA: T9SS type A sorting domain-containing protein, partial [Chitinophaga sp.]|nr:T9SS type A sorting domain-containing protein [Chitinophaga sp.]